MIKTLFVQKENQIKLLIRDSWIIPVIKQWKIILLGIMKIHDSRFLETIDNFKVRYLQIYLYICPREFQILLNQGKMLLNFSNHDSVETK